MCANYAHEPIQPFDRNRRAKVKTYYISQLFICDLIFADMSLEKDSTSSL
jgi:hypothetical protein